jgi:hypothetical protein
MRHQPPPPEKVASTGDDHEKKSEPNDGEDNRFKRLLGRLIRVSRSELEERERLWRLNKRGNE